MRAAIRWFGKNFPTLLLAFILAIAVWVSAVVAADPNEQHTLRPITMEMTGGAPDMVRVGAVNDQVRLTIKAPKSIWTQLNNNPNLAHAWVDLTGLEPGEHDLDVKVLIDIRPTQLVQVEPANIHIKLEPLVRREIPVELTVTGELPIGYKQDTANIQPGRITVSGPQSAVERAARAIVGINVSGAIETVEKTIPVEIQDADGATVRGLTVSPPEVNVIQPISLLGRFKNVAVKIVTTGQVANGYRLTNISVSPPTFTVFSNNPDLINELPGFVETLPVDINNLTEDAEISVALNLPEGITTVREPTVLVQVSVAAIEGSLTLSLPVEIIGLAPDLLVGISPETVDVIVAGPLNVLDKLSAESFRVVLDLTGLPPGVYQRSPVVDQSPDQVRVQTILPEIVEVKIEPAPTPTLSPTGLITATVQTATPGRPTPTVQTATPASPTPTSKP
jgi:YbbR domain-containing protein